MKKEAGNKKVVHDNNYIKVKECYSQIDRRKSMRVSFFCNKDGKKLANILEDNYQDKLLKNEFKYMVSSIDEK